MPIRHTARNSGYYYVYINNVLISGHITEREALEVATNVAEENPGDIITTIHDYQVTTIYSEPIPQGPIVEIFEGIPTSTPMPSGTTWVDVATGDDNNTYAQVSGDPATYKWATLYRAVKGCAPGGTPSSSEAAQAGDTVIIAAGTYDIEEYTGPHTCVYNPQNSGSSGNPIIFQAEYPASTTANTANHTILRHLITLTFNSGSEKSAGVAGIEVGDYISDSVYDVSATVAEVNVTSGSWAGGDAAGTIKYYDQQKRYNSFFMADGATINIVADPTADPSVATYTNVATIVSGGDISKTCPLIGASSKNYIEWDGFYIDMAQCNNYIDGGIADFRSATNFKIRNMFIKGNYYATGGAGDNHNGIRVETCVTGDIYNNKIYNMDGNSGESDACIEGYGSKDITVRNNYLYDSGSCGVFVKGNGGQRQQRGWNVYNNKIDNIRVGMYIIGGIKCRFYQNLVIGGANGETGIFVHPAGTESYTHTGANNASTLTDSSRNYYTDTWVDCLIKNTTDGSQMLATANTATTISGTLSGGTDNDWDTNDVYTIYETYNPKIFNNTVYGFKWQLRLANYTSDAVTKFTKLEFFNNILYLTTTTTDYVNYFVARPDDIVDAGNSSANIFEHNCLYRSANTAYATYTSDSGARSLASWATALTQDSVSPVSTLEDPLFTSAGTDFTLQGTSPCLDDGIDYEQLLGGLATASINRGCYILADQSDVVGLVT